MTICLDQSEFQNLYTQIGLKEEENFRTDPSGKRVDARMGETILGSFYKNSKGDVLLEAQKLTGHFSASCIAAGVFGTVAMIISVCIFKGAASPGLGRFVWPLAGASIGFGAVSIGLFVRRDVILRSYDWDPESGKELIKGLLRAAASSFIITFGPLVILIARCLEKRGGRCNEHPKEGTAALSSSNIFWYFMGMQYESSMYERELPKYKIEGRKMNVVGSSEHSQVDAPANKIVGRVHYQAYLLRFNNPRAFYSADEIHRKEKVEVGGGNDTPITGSSVDEDHPEIEEGTPRRFANEPKDQRSRTPEGEKKVGEKKGDGYHSPALSAGQPDPSLEE